jgi:hypothetical protein
MSLRQRYIKVISQIMPAGAIGLSLLLSTAAPGEAAQHPVGSQLSTADRFTVAERLAAIRQQVSDVAPDAVTSRPGEQLLAWGIGGATADAETAVGAIGAMAGTMAAGTIGERRQSLTGGSMPCYKSLGGMSRIRLGDV